MPATLVEHSRFVEVQQRRARIVAALTPAPEAPTAPPATPADTFILDDSQSRVAATTEPRPR